MPTIAEIDEQLALERDAAFTGVSRLRANTKKLEEKEYASATVYGAATVKTLTPIIAAKIKEARALYQAGKAGRYVSEVSMYTDELEPLALANITLKVVLDQLFTGGQPHNAYGDEVTLVTRKIGAAIAAELQMRHYEREVPGLFSYFRTKYWHSAAGTDNKQKLMQIKINRVKETGWVNWPQALKVRIGGWYLNHLLTSCGWFDVVAFQNGKKKVSRLVPTAEFLQIKTDLLRQAEIWSTLLWPMIVEPNDWTMDRPGGYLLSETRMGQGLIRRRGSKEDDGGVAISEREEPMELPLKFLNRLQKVSYRVNPFTFQAAQELMERKIQVGKFIPILELPLPSKPPDIAENEEARLAYRRGVAEAMNSNAGAYRRATRTRAVMEVAGRFSQRPRFYLPWSFDYRGRAYPIPVFLHPHDTDFGKSLIRFADEAPLNPRAEEWLAFQVGTTYGLDKAPIVDRIQWARDNHALISAISEDPIGRLPDWEAADEPWQFLAACEEYHACVIAKIRSTTGLPVAIDATCSGLQILSGLARDAKAAKLVNVLPSDRPQDAYAAVAAEAAPHVPESIRPYLDRKVTKRVVMTIPYSAKLHSNRIYIREALKEKGLEPSKEDLEQTVRAVRRAVEVVLPGPMAVMAWIEAEVSERFRYEQTPLRWVTPSGFKVVQDIQKETIEQVNLHLMGRVRVNVINLQKPQGPDKQRHRNATSPNLIHSLDASMLHKAFQDFKHPFSVIHDSLLGRAPDMDHIAKSIRIAYADLFSSDILLDWAQQIGAVTPPPVIGDLDPQIVKHSDYFFS